MDPEFWDYFLHRLEGIRERVSGELEAGDAHPDAAAVRAVDSAVEQEEPELRPDARLLLVVLAREFATLPTSAVRPELSEEVASAIRDDVRTIVRRAADLQQGGEVSSHAVIDALSATWGDLRTTSFHVWG
jgi:hypothetical protein